MRNLSAAALVLAALLSACSSPSAPKYTKSILGFWTSPHSATASWFIEFAITGDSARALTGCVLVDYYPQNHPYDRAVYELEGTLKGDSVLLDMPAGFGHSWLFDGLWTGDDTITGAGMLDSGGYQATMTRSSGVPGC